jgi:serine/threonine protein kinase
VLDVAHLLTGMSDTPFQAPTIEYLAGLLPQYDIESFIAQGGMGAVYKARQISLDRDVAIKILPKEMGEDPEFRESFETEAKAMARLNHPNLLGVFDYGSAEGMPYIVMEYVHGTSLHESAWNQAVEPSYAVAIVKAICDGLAHAHQNNIVHRDIKPSNILLTQKVEPKIGDFGLAHHADSDKPGLVMGTPGYTAPEVFYDPNQAGPLADIYSVGVILHQLLTGIDPAGSMTPPAQATGNLRLDAIWRRATLADPAQRYATVAAMAADLGKWAAAKAAAPPAQRRAPSMHPVRPVQVHTSSGGGIGFKLVIICILAASIFFFYRLLQDKKQEVIVDNGATEVVVIPEPLPTPESVAPNPSPTPEPIEVGMREDPEPTPVVEPEPEEEEPVGDQPPGDADLRNKAVGLIADSRKQRDKLLAENSRTLRFELSARARFAEDDEAELSKSLEEEITGNRIPVIDGTDGFGDKIASSIKQTYAKEESIDAAYRNDLTRIRDAYVTRLKAATDETTDDDLKSQLSAQADRAGNLDAWIVLLSPEPERDVKKFSAGGGRFAGKWTLKADDSKNNQWIAHPDGRLEVVGQTWSVTWVLTDDRSLEILFEGKKPYKLTRDGVSWSGKSPFGHPVSLTPGDW